MFKSVSSIRLAQRLMIVAAALTGFIAAPASATQFFDVRITGNMLGTTSTVRCNSGSAAGCLATYPGGSSSDIFSRPFTWALGAMNLVEGDNAFSYGSSFGPGLYSGTIINHGGILTGRDLQFVFADNSCRSGAIGCRNIQASSTSFAVLEAAVPEPATWAMMLLGFGAIGFQLRRRRSAAALQVA